MPTKRQKILIISCLAGMGHVRAAQALLLSASENHPEFDCRHIDAVDYCGPLLKTSIVDSYEILIKHWPGLFKKIFEYTDTPAGKDSFEKSIFLLQQGNKKLIDYIKDFKPDRIIVTHFLIPLLLKKFNGRFPIDMVVTDYYANLLWINPTVRHLFVATEAIKEAFKTDHPSIVVSGIPVNPRFFKPKNIPELKKKFGLPAGKKVVLILSGGMGPIDTSTATETILQQVKNISVIAVAGKHNGELLEKLQKLSGGKNHYQALSFVEKVDELMALADIIVTKPGGLTTSEVLYLKKPLVMINPIPGQEEKNAGFVIKHNYGCLATTTSELPGLINRILDEPNFLTKPPDLPNPNEIILTTN